MTETCPVCGDGIEHRRTERAEAGDADAGGARAGGAVTGGGVGASFDIDDLCAVDADTRWDRICAAATTDEGSDGADAPVLAIYYHFSGDGES